MDAATNTSSMLLSEAYLHGVVEGIALRKKVVSGQVVKEAGVDSFLIWFFFADLEAFIAAFKAGDKAYVVGHIEQGEKGVVLC